MEFTCYSEHCEYIYDNEVYIIFVRSGNLIRVELYDDIKITMDIDELYETDLLLNYYIASLVLTNDNYKPVKLSLGYDNFTMISPKIIVYDKTYILGKKNILSMSQSYYDDRKYRNSKFDMRGYLNSLKDIITPLYGFIKENPDDIKLKLSSRKKINKFYRIFKEITENRKIENIEFIVDEYIQLETDKINYEINEIEKVLEVFKILSFDKELPLEITKIILDL